MTWSASSPARRQPEPVAVLPGRQLIRSGDVLTTCVVGLSGTVLVWGPEEHMACIQAPFRFDRWICDEDGRAMLDVMAQSDLEVLLGDLDFDEDRNGGRKDWSASLATSTATRLVQKSTFDPVPLGDCRSTSPARRTPSVVDTKYE